MESIKYFEQENTLDALMQEPIEWEQLEAIKPQELRERRQQALAAYKQLQDEVYRNERRITSMEHHINGMDPVAAAPEYEEYLELLMAERKAGEELQLQLVTAKASVNGARETLEAWERIAGNVKSWINAESWQEKKIWEKIEIDLDYIGQMIR